MFRLTYAVGLNLSLLSFGKQAIVRQRIGAVGLTLIGMMIPFVIDYFSVSPSSRRDVLADVGVPSATVAPQVHILWMKSLHAHYY